MRFFQGFFNSLLDFHTPSVTSFVFHLKFFAVRRSLTLQAAAFRLSVLPGAGRGRRPGSGFERAAPRNPTFSGACGHGAWRLLQRSMRKESL